MLPHKSSSTQFQENNKGHDDEVGEEHARRIQSRCTTAKKSDDQQYDSNSYGYVAGLVVLRYAESLMIFPEVTISSDPDRETQDGSTHRLLEKEKCRKIIIKSL